MVLQGEFTELLEVDRSGEIEVQLRKLQQHHIMCVLQLILNNIVHYLQSLHVPRKRDVKGARDLLCHWR